VTYSQAISPAVYDEPGQNSGCSNIDAIKVENDGGEPIGTPVGPKGDNLWKTTVQNALAQSSNTAFTDLAHRASTTSIIQMAANFGVDIKASGLSGDIGLVPAVALGESSLTVNEQAQMIATIDDNGVFHQGHVVKYWQLPDGPEQTPSIESHVVLTPAQASQVQYAMEATTVDGTAVDAAVGLGGRQIIGKTGTTSNEHSGFFIGAIPQYALAVGMFTNEQNSANADTNSLAELGGGGFGGYWSAKIWNTFAQAEFASLPAESFQNPQFSGQLWNMIGKIPKAKKKKKTPAKCNQVNPGRGHGRRFAVTVPDPNCVTSSPTPTPTPTPTATASGLPTGTPTGLPTSTVSPTPTPSTSTSATPTATATVTPTATATRTGFPFGGDSATATAGGVKAGLAVGGVLVTVLPGSLLWTSASRRRRRRAEAGSAHGTETER
jgi:membrane peptidoglycan carboxypeptidase